MPSTPHEANVLAIGHKIFLDDERAPPPGNWLVARDATQFRALLRDHKPKIISFDHDLGCDERGAELPSGQHCLRQLIGNAMERPAAFEHLRRVVLHSAIPIGRANMRGPLENAQRHGILPSTRFVDLSVTSTPLTTWCIT